MQNPTQIAPSNEAIWTPYYLSHGHLGHCSRKCVQQLKQVFLKSRFCINKNIKNVQQHAFLESNLPLWRE